MKFTMKYYGCSKHPHFEEVFDTREEAQAYIDARNWAG
jgi:hypothetical protein